MKRKALTILVFAGLLLLPLGASMFQTGASKKETGRIVSRTAGMADRQASEGDASPRSLFLSDKDSDRHLGDISDDPLRGTGSDDSDLRPAAQRPQSSDGVWQTIDNSSIAAADWQAPPADSYQVLRLNKDALAQQLARAPMERTGDLRESPAVLSLPMPDGSFERFHIEESPVMDADLVAKYPEIKSYRGQGIEDGTATVRFDWTPLGFHALVLAPGHAVNILPPNQTDISTYASYYDQGEAFECAVTDQHQTNKAGPGGRVRPEVAVGTTLRTYRIAVAATHEFCALVGGDTLAGSTAAINTFLNGINAIWERELSVHMNLVNAPTVVYAGNTTNCGGVACTDANDPYTNGATATMLNEVRPDLDTKVGQTNYDVGHVLGTNSGGIAFVGVVCQNALCNAQPGACKGGGASGMTAPAGNSGSVGLWAHELGHEFGGNHTHNAITGACGPGSGANDNRDGATAVEPGSGTTILSYVGICGAGDNISNTRDLRWHAGTFADISAFLAGAQAMGCAVNTATGNNIPTVNAGAPFTIPRNTPFTLTATGTDADAADIPNLTFIWEQVDAAGGTDCTLAGNLCNPPYGDQPADVGNTRPLFRSFSPIKGKTRTFPSLTYILNNANVPPAVVGGFRTAEDLPSRSRPMNFRATVRDNRAGFGGVNDSSVTITVDGNSGPFQVTAPNTAVVLTGGTPTNFTWNVNNTNNPPVSAANVKISFSTDGGNTFPNTVLASTPNDGSETITPPNGIVTSQGRIKVEAVGNIFFDISDVNFTLQPGDGCLASSDISPKVGRVGDQVIITGFNFTGVNAVTFSNSVPATTFTVDSNTQITATVPAGAVGGPITLGKPGCGNLQTAGYNVCLGLTTLQNDDGTFGSASTIGDGYYVNRLTPGVYPATLGQVQVRWDGFQNFPAGTAVTVVAGINAGGGANIDGTTFQTFAGTVGTLGAFTTFTLPNPVRITAGDFVVGFQAINTTGGQFPILTDPTTPQSRSYNSDSGTAFTTDTTRNYAIRAVIFTGNCTGPTAANGNVGGTITDASGTAVSGVTINLSGTMASETITDAGGHYSFDGVETNGFYTVTPSRVNYTFSPANRSFSLLGVHTDASFTAAANGAHLNAIDTSEFFVRQQYLDFLFREPDPPGFSGWVNTLRNCAAGDASCDRIHVSEMFYRSPEFQERGYFAYRFYATALGRKPDYAEFVPDLARVSGFLTNDQLDAAKTAFIDDFMSRPAFAAMYNSQSNAAYVNALVSTAGVALSNQQALINELNNGTATRAQVLRQIAESGEVYQKYYNQAFVVMEYFGYLRRDPDALYLNWISVLDANSADSRHMVEGFVNSTEYRQRFVQ
jgi:hypothetical protein